MQRNGLDKLKTRNGNRLKRDVGYVGGRVTDLSTCAVEILGEKLSKPTPKLSPPHRWLPHAGMPACPEHCRV